ncbi:MAG: hypothetical protein K2N10_05340, partial [Muribaculaceae bacterium]|nr:hypothetical protein [Muribaculaceae bacterium]
MIGSANTPSLSFEKVELTDSSTVLHSVVNFGPGMWVRIAPSSAIQVDGVSYPLSSIEGIAAGEQVVMPDSGVIRFTMTFPAIPENAKSLNFSEGVDNGWAIWNVDLTGKAAHNQNSSLVPKAALKNKPSIPEEMMAYGDTTVINFHILGYKPEMGNRLSWAANTLHGQIGLDLPEAEVDAEGNAVVKLMLSAPADMMPIRLNSGVNIGGTFFVAPGETVNAYLDTHMSGIWNMEVRDGEAMIAPDADYQQVYTDGIYPILRRELSMQLYSGEFGDYHMNGDEYTAYILDIHKSLSDSIDACQGMSDANRRYNKAWLDGELIVATTAAKLWLERNYYHQYGWNSQIPADSINCQLSPENIKAIAAQIDFNNPLLLLTGDLEHNTKVEMWEQAGVDAGVLKTLENYVSAYDAADNGALDEQALAGMN